MNKIEIRNRAGTKSPQDLVANVQDATFEYLLTSTAPKIRISAYLDQDWPVVQSSYAEVFIRADCPFDTVIEQVIPGSKTREGISLPGPMMQGEQLTLMVVRTPKAGV